MLAHHQGLLARAGRNGVDEMAQNEIVSLTDDALQSVESLNLGKVRFEMLKRFADKLVGRNN